MCVIALVEGDKPSLTAEAVEAMYQSNNDGAGFAWREGKRVFWKKGLDMEQAIKLAEELPKPYVAHFRVASCGGVLPELTHPFSVLPSVPLKLEGDGEHSVLFHNGHWGDWKIETFRKVTRETPIPSGPWSDTRAIAWLVANYGDTKTLLEMIGEKTILFGPKGYSIQGKGWQMFENKWLVSNEFWTGRYNSIMNRQYWKEHDKDAPRQVASTNQNPPRRSIEYYENLHRQGKLNKNGLKRLRRWFALSEELTNDSTTQPS